jgi:hypothetical protein
MDSVQGTTTRGHRPPNNATHGRNECNGRTDGNTFINSPNRGTTMLFLDLYSTFCISQEDATASLYTSSNSSRTRGISLLSSGIK